MLLILIDDEERVLESLKKEVGLVFSDGDFDIESFSDPLKALDRIREKAEDIFLVITDLRMPSMSGIRVLEEIRLISEDIPSVLLTGYSDLADIQKAVSISIQGLLFKPWAQNELFNEIVKAKKHRQLQKDFARISHELDVQMEMAAEFQTSMFPDAVYHLPSSEISILYRPHKTYGSGGDCYDFLDLGKGSFAFLYGDASGHGIRAAYVSVILKTLTSLLKSSSPELFRTPAMLMAKINKAVAGILGEANPDFIAMTALYYDSAKAALTYCCAGQPPIFLLREENVERLISDNNIAVGVSPEGIFTEKNVQISSGDRIILMSDGIIEMLNNCYSEAYRSCEEAILNTSGKTGSELLQLFCTRTEDINCKDDIILTAIDFGGSL